MIYKGVELYNVQDLLEDEHGHGRAFTRIPNSLRMKINDSARLRALETAGCEIRFNLKSNSATISLESQECPSIVEVYQGCFLVAWHIIATEPTEISVGLPPETEQRERLTKEKGLPFDANLTRILLPWRPAPRLIDIEGEFDPPRPEQTPSMKYLSYGSSITHGSSAIRPTGSYAERTAQLLGVDLINLGFGGGAHLEPEMADYIAGRTDWDIATLEMGINVISSIEKDEFAKRVDYFVTTIAQSHPEKWIFCIDLFTCRWDFDDSQKILAFRNVVREKVEKLNMPRLVYISGADILRSVSGLTWDLVHPSPYGMEEMAANLSRRIRFTANLR